MEGDILLRLIVISQGHDMVANDASYPAPYMKLLNDTTEHVRYVMFNRLVEQLEVSLFEEKCGFLIKSVRY